MFHKEFCLLFISTLYTLSFGTNFPSYFVPSQVLYLRPGTSVRVGHQMPPHPEPDAILINVNNPGGPGVFGQPGNPGVFGQPGGPGVFGQPGGPGVYGQPGNPGVFGQPGGPGVFGQPGGPGVFGQPGGPGVFGQPGGPGVYGHPGGPGVYGHPGGPGVFGQPGGPGVYGQPGNPGVFGHPGGPGVYGQPGGPGVFGQPDRRAVYGPPGGPGMFGPPSAFGYPQPGTFRHMQPGSTPGGFVPMVDSPQAFGRGFNVHRPSFPGNSFIPRGNPGHGHGVQGGDSGREMFDEPNGAEMFPLIDNST